MSSDRFSKRQDRPPSPTGAKKDGPSSGLRCASQRIGAPVLRVCHPRGRRNPGPGPGNAGLRPGRGGAGYGGSLGVPVGAHSSSRGAMEAPAELLAALPALATALALLLAWLLVRRAQAASSHPAAASLEPAPRTEASGNSALRSPGAPEPAAAPEEPGEPAGPAEAEEQAAEAKQEEEEREQGQEEEREQEGRQDPAEPEEEEGGEAFSFKYSPGKLRGNQYKKMMTKEELEEEQRVQKEQLAAIFKLMKDNKETFGEMSDGDVQEQLRLYDM